MKKLKILLTTFILICMMAALSSCGSSLKSATSTSNSPTQREMVQQASNSKDDVAINGTAASNTGNTASSAASQPDKSTQNQNSSKIVKTATIEMETLKFDNTVNVLLSKTSELGGYVESSNITGTRIDNTSTIQNRSANLKLRIPKNNYNSFMQSFGSLGSVTRKEESGENVTSQYYDTEAHLKAYEVQEDRELELMKKATDINSILQLEKELTNVRYQIESLTTSLKTMDNMVDYTTFNVSVTEVQNINKIKQKPVSLLSKIATGFSDSINAIIQIIKVIVIGIAYVLPFAVIGIVVFIIYWYARKIYKNKNKNK